MNDYGYLIRKAYFEAINGQVTIAGSVIPIADEKLDTQLTEHDIYMLFKTQQVQQVNNKSYYAGTVTMNIDIVQRTKSVASKIVLDDVANQVLGILFPTKTTNGLNIDSPMRLSFARFENSNTTNTIPIPDGFITVKTLTFTNRLYQP
jgi:hypothetical protein